MQIFPSFFFVQLKKSCTFAPEMRHVLLYNPKAGAAHCLALSQQFASLIVAHTKHRVRALWLFAMALFGKHINYPDAVSQLQGNEIEVVFTAPQTVQVDGEVFRNILSYRVQSR